MPHDTPLISTIVAGLVLAFIFGAIANRFRMPPLVGYLLAGVLVGPYTPGFVANGELATELSELGVILLMFGVGLHFSLKDMLSVQAVAVPGALLRIAGGTAMGVGLAILMGWSFGAGLIFGLALSVASTVVLLKALQDRHLVDSDRGRIAVGWVVVEDVAMVLALVLIPAFAPLMGGTATEVHDPFVDLVERFAHIQLSVWGVLAVTIVKLAAFVGFMLVVGRRVIPWILHLTAHTGSRELFRLAVLAIALGVAAGASYLFGVSLALGAFFAGMILSESELANRAAQESLPLRDAFSVLFFVSVGMLFDPTILWTQPLPVIGTLFVILVGKTVIGYFLVRVLGRPASAALSVAASLAQIGEFSFILAALGVGLGVLPEAGQDYILAGAIISIVANPLLVYMAEHWRPRLEARTAAAGGGIVIPNRVEPALGEGQRPAPFPTPAAAPAEADERVPTTLTDHVVLIGYGRVGGVVAEGLRKQGTPFVLIEDAEKRVAAAHAAGIEVIVGNAATGESLLLANVERARMVLIAIPNAFEAGQAVEQCHKLNPKLTIVARAHSDEEVEYLKNLGANEVIMGEREIGLGMLAWTNGDAERNRDAERAAGSIAAVAAALNLEPTPAVAAEPTVPQEPVVDAPPEVLERAIEAAHPEHEPEGPAEPPELVPALGEMPDEALASAPAGGSADATADADLPEMVITSEMPGAAVPAERESAAPAAIVEVPVTVVPSEPVRKLPPGAPATSPGNPYTPGPVETEEEKA